MALVGITVVDVADPRELTRADFDFLSPIATRWRDNDMFGHLNNAVYYELFDTAINSWLIASAGVAPLTLPELGVVAESSCRYFREVEFPGIVEIGVRIARVGTSSVTYELGVFDSAADVTAAFGRWVHVYISREQRRPIPIPRAVRQLFDHTVDGREG